MINSLLKFNEKKRLGAKGWAEVKKHAFFNNFDWKALEEQRMESPLKEIVNQIPATTSPYEPTEAPIRRVEQPKIKDFTYTK